MPLTPSTPSLCYQYLNKPDSALPDSHTPSTTHLDLQSYPIDIQNLLNIYQTIITKPSGLPHPRPHDHHIHLLPNIKPVNIKSYRYPHFQKEAMTTLIAEMLQDGIIQPRTSPYSTPVVGFPLFEL